MKKTVLFTLCISLVAIVIGCGEKCDNPSDSSSSDVYYCDYVGPPPGKPYAVAWMSILPCDECWGEAWVEVDFLRLFYTVGKQKILQYADEYNDISRYTNWIYGSAFSRLPWYKKFIGPLKNGSFNTKIANGKLYLPVSAYRDIIFHPVSSSYPNKPVPSNANSFIIEVGFTIHGKAQVQVGLDGWTTQQTGQGDHVEIGASDWLCEEKTYNLSIVFDEKTR